MVQAKFPKPHSLLADLRSISIKDGCEILIMVKDNTVIRQREKAHAEKYVQTLFFASVAHNLRTPLNSMLASNTLMINSVNNKKTKLDALKDPLRIQQSSI